MRDSPGLTVAHLRDELGVGRERIRQVVARLEWLGVIDRLGAPPPRLNPEAPTRPVTAPATPIQTGPAWRAAIPASAYLPIPRHLAINTMLVFEHLSTGPLTASELAALMPAPLRSVNRLLRRLEHDGLIEPIPRTRARRWRLAAGGLDLGRQLARAVCDPARA